MRPQKTPRKQTTAHCQSSGALSAQHPLLRTGRSCFTTPGMRYHPHTDCWVSWTQLVTSHESSGLCNTVRHGIYVSLRLNPVLLKASAGEGGGHAGLLPPQSHGHEAWDLCYALALGSQYGLAVVRPARPVSIPTWRAQRTAPPCRHAVMTLTPTDAYATISYHHKIPRIAS